MATPGISLLREIQLVKASHISDELKAKMVSALEQRLNALWATHFDQPPAKPASKG